MSAITERRAELRREARELQRAAIPALKAKVREQRKAKTKRLAKCRADAKRRAAAVQRDAGKARGLLRLGIQRAKEKAQAAAKACKVSATGEQLAAVDKALAAVEVERENIAELRRRAAMLRDPRGRAGGRRRAELKAESDDEVARNVADDDDLAALWASTNKARFQSTPQLTRTEAFLQYVHDHPEALDELRSRQEVAYEREAAELLASWPRDEPVGKLGDEDLGQLVTDLQRAQELAEAPF